MTAHNSLHTAGSVVQAVDARLSMAGYLGTDAAAPAVRQGVLYAPGGPLLVTGTSSTSPWQYSVAAGSAVTSKGALDGAHVVTNDAPLLVSTIAPPGSNSRYDLIYIMQLDSAATISPDGSTAASVGVVNGTAAAVPTVPSAPAGSVILGVARVYSTATAGTSGANVTITQSGQVPGGTAWIAPYTVARGAALPVRNAAEEAAITGGNALTLYRLDISRLRMWNGSAYVSAAGPTAFNATTSFGAVPTGQTYGVGGVVVNSGSAVTSGGTDSLTWQVSGFVILDALFYIPTANTKYAWINVPGTTQRFMTPASTTTDRVSLSAAKAVAAGDTWVFQQRQESGGNLATTLTVDGIFIPS